MTADELMNAQNDARRAHIRQQLGSGWAGNPADLEVGATTESNRCVPRNPPTVEELEAMHNVARVSALHGRAAYGPYAGASHGAALGQSARGEPGKMFTRSDILAIIRGQMAITHDSHMRDLLTIFENLE